MWWLLLGRRDVWRLLQCDWERILPDGGGIRAVWESILQSLRVGEDGVGGSEGAAVSWSPLLWWHQDGRLTCLLDQGSWDSALDALISVMAS